MRQDETFRYIDLSEMIEGCNIEELK